MTMAENRIDNMTADLAGASQGNGSAAAPIVLHMVELAKRHLLLIAAIIATALIAALVFTLLATPLYTSSTRIEIAREQANITNVEGLQRDNLVGSVEYYNTQHALLAAQSLAERVTRRLRLTQDEQFLDAYGFNDSGALADAAPARPTRDQLRQREQNIAGILRGGVAINPLRNSALVDVQFTSPDPQLSMRIANAWVQEYIRQSMDRRFGSSADARAFLETRLEGLRQRLEQSERDLQNYAERENIVRLAEVRSDEGRTQTTQTLVGADLQALNEQLAEATAARIEAEGRRDASRARRANEATVTNPALNSLRQRRAELSAQYAQLMERFEPEYPEAQAVQRQIANLDGSIGAEERRVLSSIDTTFDAAARREAGLRERVSALLGQLDGENRAQIQYNIYQREVDTNRQLYDTLLQRYREIGVAGVGTNNIAVIDEARLPFGPSSPNLLLNLVLAFLVGLGLAAATVFAIENLDEAIRRPQQIAEILRLPLLGAIPVENNDEPIALIRDPKSTLSEAYMSVRTNLGFSTDHGAPRSMSITSTSPSEGKSTTSLSVAAMLARTGRRVILVDLDLRRPAMAKTLGLDRRVGVSNFLSGTDDWRGMVQDTGFANLTFLASGPVPPSAPELLSGDRLRLLVEELSASFDHVIIDGPPMLALSDAQLIARVVEGVIFVVESGRTPIRAVEATIKRLRDNGVRLFGVVLTKYRAQASTYGYGYQYDYQYSYGDKRD